MNGRKCIFACFIACTGERVSIAFGREGFLRAPPDPAPTRTVEMTRTTVKKKAVAKPPRRRPRARRAPTARRHVRAIEGLDGVRLVTVDGDGGTKLELRHLLAMRRESFGRLVNVSVRTLAEVESKHTAVEKLRRNYVEVERLCNALGEVVDARTLGKWFETPNRMFAGLKPLEVLERGEIDRLWEMYYRLRSGMPS